MPSTKIWERKIAEQTVIGTTTMYRTNAGVDAYRANLAIAMVSRAVDAGYNVFVVDGGSTHKAVKELEKAGATLVVDTKASMGQSRRSAIRCAHNNGRSVVCWTEPEKEPLVDELYKLAAPILNDNADLTVPNRDMSSYPLAQQYAEQFGNKYWGSLMSELDEWFKMNPEKSGGKILSELSDFDVDMSGPRLWRSAVSRLFLDYDGRHGDKWESMFVPVFRAAAQGYRVKSVNVNYVHPAEQRGEDSAEFCVKRLQQLENIMHALDSEMKALRASA